MDRLTWGGAMSSLMRFCLTVGHFEGYLMYSRTSSVPSILAVTVQKSKDARILMKSSDIRVMLLEIVSFLVAIRSLTQYFNRSMACGVNAISPPANCKC